MPEGIVDLTVAITPKHVGKRLADIGTGFHRLREDCIRIVYIEGKDHCCPADRWRGENAHLGELVSDMHQPTLDA